MLEVNLAEDVFPISEAQDRLRRVIAKAAETGRPMVITQKGKPVAAVIGIAEFERLRRLAELAEDYRAIIEAQEGPWLSHEEVWGAVNAELQQAQAPERRGHDAGPTAAD